MATCLHKNKLTMLNKRMERNIFTKYTKVIESIRVSTLMRKKNILLKKRMKMHLKMKMEKLCS